MSHVMNPELVRVEDFAMGANIDEKTIEEIWEKHKEFYPEAADYLTSMDAARRLLDSCGKVDTQRFYIIEALNVKEYLDPAIVRYINFIHKGTKVICTLDNIIYVPKWCVKDDALLRNQMLEAYFAEKRKRLSLRDKLKLYLELLKTELFSAETFSSSHAAVYERIIRGDIKKEIKFC